MDAVEDRLLLLPVEMITKDPWKVPVELLDLLAWEHSVDVWDSSWDESIKRGVIAVSAEVHRFKGTPYAVKKAMEVFGVEVELVEWWQPVGSGVPGTYKVTAYATNPLNGDDELVVDGPVISAMKQVLATTAPVSRTWELQIGAQIDVPAYVGVWPKTQIVAVAEYRIDPPPVSIVAANQTVVPTVRLSADLTAVAPTATEADGPASGTWEFDGSVITSIPDDHGWAFDGSVITSIPPSS